MLAGLFFVAFAFDVVVVLLSTLAAAASGNPEWQEPLGILVFRGMDLLAALISAVMWWVAGNRRASPTFLHTAGLAYCIVICFMISLTAPWRYYLDTGHVPNLTWVPAVVILFPLILPGPPRRMTLAAAAAGAMSPLGLLLLDLSHRITIDTDGYMTAIVSSGFAVAFASMGARVIYGLGREVTAARELGSYQLQGRLGEGGMGEVWRATHRMLARPAAVKLIRPALARATGQSDVTRARFEREAQAIAALRSPHTVELYDFGVSDRGVFYYAMELLDGLDTETLVKQFGPLPPERVVHVLRQICHSLAEAASQGLVHRDIKPANIFLCRYGKDVDFVKVLDFGLVTALGQHAEESADALTRENAIHGTPTFMSPEQALGMSDIDERADIYAMGCVAYWLLTGRRVFTGDTPISVVLQHANAQPTPPSQRTHLPIPAALDTIVISCLAKDREARPQTADALSELLKEVEVTNAWTVERAEAWWLGYESMRGQPATETGAAV